MKPGLLLVAFACAGEREERLATLRNNNRPPASAQPSGEEQTSERKPSVQQRTEELSIED